MITTRKNGYLIAERAAADISAAEVNKHQMTEAELARKDWTDAEKDWKAQQSRDGHRTMEQDLGENPIRTRAYEKWKTRTAK